MKILGLVGKCAFCVVLLVSLAMSDSIQLRNGRQIHGKYIGGTATSIGFVTGGAVQYISTSEVLALMFDDNPDSPLGELQPNAFHQPAGCPPQPSEGQSSAVPSTYSLIAISLPARALQFAQLAHLVPLDSDAVSRPVTPYGESADTDALAPLPVNLISWESD